jgi:putative ABC transport system permease protein
MVFQNISDIYLNSEFIPAEVHKRGNKRSLYVYSSLALFILLLAGINYSMLSTARSSMRFKEIGMRKVLGASRGALRTQVLTESTFLTLLSFPISILLIGLLEPFSEYLLGYQVRIYSNETLAVLPVFAALTIFIGLVSGSYLSFYLSGLNPIHALRNQVAAYKKINLSKLFTIFQLLITIMLLISVITIYRQIRYSLSNELGIRKGNIMLLNMKSTNPSLYNKLKQDVSNIPEIQNVSGSSFIFPDFSMATKTMVTIESEAIDFEIYAVDTGFFRTLGIDFIEGSDFNPSDTLNIRKSIIINKEAVKAFRFSDPMNSKVNDRTVIGVVSDVNFHSTHSRINPFIYEYRPESLKTIIIKYDNITDKEILSRVSVVWKKVFPEIPIDYRFIGQELNEMYQQERSFGKVVTAFTILAFIITGMGLFGLALLMSERKTKETAIRKVFGASNRSIIFGMQREFMIYIGVASIIAVPLTWYAMYLWLANFYYKISLDWWIFATAIMAVTIFVSSILYFKTLGVLRENPANALRYE